MKHLIKQIEKYGVALGHSVYFDITYLVTMKNGKLHFEYYSKTWEEFCDSMFMNNTPENQLKDVKFLKIKFK